MDHNFTIGRYSFIKILSTIQLRIEIGTLVIIISNKPKKKFKNELGGVQVLRRHVGGRGFFVC